MQGRHGHSVEEGRLGVWDEQWGEVPSVPSSPSVPPPHGPPHTWVRERLYRCGAAPAGATKATGNPAVLFGNTRPTQACASVRAQPLPSSTRSRTSDCPTTGSPNSSALTSPLSTAAGLGPTSAALLGPDVQGSAR